MIVGAGEGLGFFEQDTGLTYGVRFYKQTFPLTKQAYSVWQIANMAAYELSELPAALQLPVDIVEQELQVLREKGLVLEWPTKPSKEFLATYTLVPKGKIIKYENDEWVFRELMGDTMIAFDILPTTLWRLANPFWTLETLFENVVAITGHDEKQTIELSMKWIPHLISRGFLALEKW
ncbi:hypothetical protein [Peribacillus frigoritolerans]|uniref:hypothetical protein n=1 Tax=Peribacillus frigoritolerans TaxID=450367 RepID=UPI0039A0D151